MTFGGYIVSFMLGALSVFGLLFAGNYLKNWDTMPSPATYKRAIACTIFSVSAVFFFTADFLLFPLLLSFIILCIVAPILGWIFYEGFREKLDTLYAQYFPERVQAAEDTSDEQDFRELEELERPTADEDRALDQVHDRLQAFTPPPGPFEIQYFDLVPMKKLAHVIDPTTDTSLSGYVPKSFDVNKWKTVRQASATFAPSLKQLFRQTVAFGFSDEQRFRHQFIVGATGSGKTTLLSAQILDDLSRVAEGKASLFIMDSQNELIPNIARLKAFAPGELLHGKLIYIEYDPDYPLSLNIFDFNKDRMASLSSRERVTLMRGTEEMVGFFMQSLVKAETSGFMEAIIRYTLRAVMLIPNATILTFKDFLYKDGFAKYQAHLETLSENDRRFLTTSMFDGGYVPSMSALRARFDALTSDELFTAMFSHPRNKFDLFQLLQEPKVILINTAKGVLKKATEPFGRYFIARLMQATEERMLIPRASRLPVFAYIDEAGDYISDEQNIAELIDKARKQKIALTVAIQRTADIQNPNVLDALRHAAIQCWGRTQPKWNVAIDGAEPIEVTVPNTDFGTMNRMTEAQFQTILADMRNRFSVTPETPKPAPAHTTAPTTSQPQAPTDWER